MTDTTVSTDLLHRLARSDEFTFAQAELEPLRPRIDAWLTAASRTDVTATDLIDRPSAFPITWNTFVEYLRAEPPRARFLVHTDGTGRQGVLDTVTGWIAWGLGGYDASNLNEDAEGAFNWTWSDPSDGSREMWGRNYEPIIDAAREVATRPYDFDTALSLPDATALAPLLPAYTVWMRDERGRTDDTITEQWGSVTSAPDAYTTHLSLFRNWLGDHPEHVPTITGTAATQAESKSLEKWQELGFISPEAYAAFSRKVAETANRLRKCEEADQFAEELGLITRQQMSRTQTVHVDAFDVTIEVPFTHGATHFPAADTTRLVRAAIQQHIDNEVLARRLYSIADPEFVAPRY